MDERASCFLSRVELNPRDRAVQRALADCGQMHRLVMRAFPDVAEPAARQALGVLYRPETDERGARVWLLVQSGVAPTWSNIAPIGDTTTVKRIDGSYARLAAGMTLRFRLRANPTKRLGKRGPDEPEEPLAGKRIALFREEERIAWLTGRLLAAGCTPRGFEVRPDRFASGRRDLTLTGALFEGRLRVENADGLRSALATGIGPGKAYGFGLLSVAGST